MGARLLRITGMLVGLWLVLIAGMQIIGAATPLLAVSYVPSHPELQVEALDLRRGLSATLFEIDSGRILDQSWDPHTGRLAILVNIIGDFSGVYEMWVREPSGALRYTEVRTAPPMFAHNHLHITWDEDGHDIVMILLRGLIHLNPLTGETLRMGFTPPSLALVQQQIRLPFPQDVILVQTQERTADRLRYQRLDLQTGHFIDVKDLPCAGRPRVITPTYDGQRLYVCPTFMAINMGDTTTAELVITLEPFNGVGAFDAPLIAPDERHIIFRHIQQNFLIPPYYLYDLVDGNIQHLPNIISPDGSVYWIPSEALRRGR